MSNFISIVDPTGKRKYSFDSARSGSRTTTTLNIQCMDLPLLSTCEPSDQHFRFRVALREHRKLRFNPVPWLLLLAFQDNGLFGLDTVEQLEEMDPDTTEPIRLLWKPSVRQEPVLRTVTRAGGVSTRPMTRVTF